MIWEHSKVIYKKHYIKQCERGEKKYDTIRMARARVFLGPIRNVILHCIVHAISLGCGSDEGKRACAAGNVLEPLEGGKFRKGGKMGKWFRASVEEVGSCRE
jgi:hypothetical protein